MNPARGSLGPLTGTLWTRALSQAALSGTLFLSKGRSSTLFLLQEGRFRGWDVGEPYDLDEAGGRFAFWAHEREERPTLESRYPDAEGPLRALPALLEEPLFTTNEVNLRPLVARLARERFSGALVLQSRTQRGLCAFLGGTLGAVVFEEAGRLRRGGGALRGSLQGAETAALTLHPLPDPLSASFLGLALEGHTADEAGGAGSAALQAREQGVARAVQVIKPQETPVRGAGVHVGERGYTYSYRGEPLLEVRAAPFGARGFVPACADPSNLPLPTEAAGWEERRYALTLRGRDALNPMTELSMRFRSEFGRTGQRALDQFRRAPGAEAAADALGLEPSDLKSYLERLEAEGFIRRLELR